MAGFDPRWQPVITLLGQIRAAWPGGAWTWDDRFDCALCTVGKKDGAEARSAITASLPSVWAATTLKDAPARARQVCEETGGLRGDQMIFCAEPLEGILAYCLWWPWGSGANISARVGIAGADSPDEILALVRAGLAVE
jgi:hypothetical protein